MQQNAADGLRYSASRGYIHNLDVPTLELQTEVLVTKIVIENGRAVGVAVVDKDGSTRIVRAGKEVILSAGFVGSPQLLMLSGIGHAEHLTEHGITTIADLPVGDNLHDHMFHAMTFHATSATHAGQRLVLRQGRRQGAGAPGQDVPGQLGLRVGRLRAHVARDRRTRPPAAPAAVGLRLAQPGRADPPRRRPAYRR